MEQQVLIIEKESAGAIIAQLIKEGLTFEAVEQRESIKIVFTGGY